MSPSTAQKLDQIEQELTTAMTEYPSQIGIERLKFVRALVRFVKTRLDLDDESAAPVAHDLRLNRQAANGVK